MTVCKVRSATTSMDVVMTPLAYVGGLTDIGGMHVLARACRTVHMVCALLQVGCVVCD